MATDTIVTTTSSTTTATTTIPRSSSSHGGALYYVVEVPREEYEQEQQQLLANQPQPILPNSRIIIKQNYKWQRCVFCSLLLGDSNVGQKKKQFSFFLCLLSNRTLIQEC
jgi:hypothetical protein